MVGESLLSCQIGCALVCLQCYCIANLNAITSEAQGLVNTTDCRRWCNKALGDGNGTPVSYEVEDAGV